eukprot:288335_1
MEHETVLRLIGVPLQKSYSTPHIHHYNEHDEKYPSTRSINTRKQTLDHPSQIESNEKYESLSQTEMNRLVDLHERVHKSSNRIILLPSQMHPIITNTINTPNKQNNNNLKNININGMVNGYSTGSSSMSLNCSKKDKYLRKNKYPKRKQYKHSTQQHKSYNVDNVQLQTATTRMSKYNYKFL